MNDQKETINQVKSLLNNIKTYKLKESRRQDLRLQKLVDSMDKHYNCRTTQFNMNESELGEDLNSDEGDFLIEILEGNEISLKNKEVSKKYILKINEFNDYLKNKQQLKIPKNEKKYNNLSFDDEDEDDTSISQDGHHEEKTIYLTDYDFKKNLFKIELIFTEYLAKNEIKEKFKKYYLTYNEQSKLKLSPMKSYGKQVKNPVFNFHSNIKPGFFEENKETLKNKDQDKRRGTLNSLQQIKDFSKKIFGSPLKNNSQFLDSLPKKNSNFLKITQFSIEGSTQDQENTTEKKLLSNPPFKFEKRGSIFKDQIQSENRNSLFGEEYNLKLNINLNELSDQSDDEDKSPDVYIVTNEDEQNHN